MALSKYANSAAVDAALDAAMEALPATGTAADSSKLGGVAASGYQVAAKTLSLTLTTGGWSSSAQTLTATGVTATNIVFVCPAVASQAAYSAAGIVCTSQGTNELSFSCDATPAGNITVSVVIL